VSGNAVDAVGSEALSDSGSIGIAGVCALRSQRTDYGPRPGIIADIRQQRFHFAPDVRVRTLVK
jgi:hypothetical protein